MPLPMLCERGGGHIQLSQMSGLNAKSMRTGYEVTGTVVCLSTQLSLISHHPAL